MLTQAPCEFNTAQQCSKTCHQRRPRKVSHVSPTQATSHFCRNWSQMLYTVSLLFFRTKQASVKANLILPCLISRRAVCALSCAGHKQRALHVALLPFSLWRRSAHSVEPHKKKNAMMFGWNPSSSHATVNVLLRRSFFSSENLQMLLSTPTRAELDVTCSILALADDGRRRSRYLSATGVFLRACWLEGLMMDAHSHSH